MRIQDKVLHFVQVSQFVLLTYIITATVAWRRNAITVPICFAAVVGYWPTPGLDRLECGFRMLSMYMYSES